ncbi:ABC transporter ATP-binding protein [Parapedobacter deserti]|uniref:ABC transporter ATP-binding protein n=1 Tax=Parapedobacter deserti TaxID=1912957 RepID=A0ABV7JH50_9SPHI
MVKAKFFYYSSILSSLKLARTIKLVWALEPWKTVLVIAFMFISTGLLFLSLYALKDLIDVVSNQEVGSPEYGSLVIRQVLIAGGLAVLHTVVNSISAYFSELQSTLVSEKIDDMIHRHTVDLDMAYYEDPEYFNTLKLAKEAGGGRPNAVLMGLLSMLSAALKMAAASVIIISIDWRLLPILLLFVLPMFAARIYYSEKYNALRVKNTPVERISSYFGHLITSELSAREIRSYNLGDYFKRKYFGIRTHLIGERLKISRQRSKAESMVSALASLGFFSCIYFVTLGAIDGRVSTGDIAVFVVMFPMIFGYLQELTSGITAVYSNNMYVKYIFELFDLRTGLYENPNPVPIPGASVHDLTLENVSFRYPHADKMVLKDVSIAIPQGKLVALVGLNGSGKTTLIKLLARLYDPSNGRITLNGLDIREFSLSDYRKQVGIVFQDFYKYNVTAAENIFLGDIGRAQHAHDDVVHASKLAGSHGYIMEFENNYQTMMGRVFDGGHEISVGQWQKLATARAFYSAARFLVLDEATSALDAQSEHRLLDALKSTLDTRGALVISHRYSTIKHADYIYVLSEGSVVEAGTPDVLSRQNGYYAQIFDVDLRQENTIAEQ